MDPEATLIQLLNALESEDRQHAIDACGNLQGWLEKGGFFPVVEASTYDSRQPTYIIGEN